VKTINIPLLRTIIAFEESGSCQGAADIVHKTSAAVSIHLKQLEHIVDKRLFVKEGRQLKLNTDGHNLVSYARRIIRLHNEALATFNTKAFVGTLRVGIPDDYIPVLLSSLLQSFEEALPKAQIDLHCAPSAILRQMLTNNSLDIAILSTETNTQEGYVLRQETTHWIAPSGFEYDPHEKIKLLLFPDGCILRKWALNALNIQKTEYEIVCTSQNMQALKTAMSHGLGVMLATQSNIPQGSVLLSKDEGFPALPDVTIMLIASSTIDTNIINPLYEAMQNHVNWDG
jgi:DNA-binding transcriptional LysR family regulator